MKTLRARPALLLLATLACAGGAYADEPAAARASAGAGLVLDKTVQDYGVVDQNREYTAEIGYRNAGAARITELRANVSCSCYSVALTHTDLEPGAKGTLTVRFRTHGFRGKAAKRVRLLYKDGSPRDVSLKLVLNIVGGVLVERLHLGEILAGTKPSGSVPLLWYDGVGKPFEIERIEIPGQPIETRVEAFAPEKPGKFKGWRVHFVFTKPPARGVYSQKAIVTTTHPTQKRVLIPITAHVVGKVWVQTSRVYLGLVAQGTKKSAAVAFRPFKPEFKLGAVSARARKGVLQITIEDGFGSRGPVKKLRVTVPASAAPGPLDDVIELRTEVPGEELVTIEVRGRVYVKR